MCKTQAAFEPDGGSEGLIGQVKRPPPHVYTS